MKGRRFLAWVAALCSCMPNHVQNARAPADLPEAVGMRPAPSEEGLAVPIGPEDPVWGARNALVTIVLFSDFECASCAEVEITLDELRQRWGPNELRIVFKHLPQPFHPNAREAAEAAQGVRAIGGNDAFWIFHGLAFTTEEDLSPSLYEDWAARAGIDAAAIRTGLSQKAWAAKVQGDEALAVRLGVKDAHAIFVNGVEAARDKLAAVAAEERQKAREKIEQGTAAERIYETMTAINRP
jgi:protein-disulfide isomerase